MVTGLVGAALCRGEGRMDLIKVPLWYTPTSLPSRNLPELNRVERVDSRAAQ
jgi:hypothetical protein